MKQDADIFCVKYGGLCFMFTAVSIQSLRCFSCSDNNGGKKTNKQKKELHQQRLFSICPRKLG
jgi:hypothetical protein